MKQFALGLIFASALFSTQSEASMCGGYYYQPYTYPVSVSFVQYHVSIPAMCVYQRLEPRWVNVCGIAPAQVGGCSVVPTIYGPQFMCGTTIVPQTVCAYRLDLVPVLFNAPCGSVF